MNIVSAVQIKNWGSHGGLRLPSGACPTAEALLSHVLLVKQDLPGNPKSQVSQITAEAELARSNSLNIDADIAGG